MQAALIAVVTALVSGGAWASEKQSQHGNADRNGKIASAAPLADRIVQQRDDCLGKLHALKVAFSSENPARAEAACTIDNPVRLEKIPLRNGGLVQLPDKPLLSCAAALVLTEFSRDLLQPLAHHHMHRDLTHLSTGPGYDCRTRNRVPGAKISAHGQGVAIDIMAIQTAPVKIVIETPADDGQRNFIAGIRTAACGWFTTVLGPGNDPAHRNHLHFDLEKRGRDGTSRLCQ